MPRQIATRSKNRSTFSGRGNVNVNVNGRGDGRGNVNGNGRGNANSSRGSMIIPGSLQEHDASVSAFKFTSFAAGN
jgi:hypothetical protein